MDWGSVMFSDSSMSKQNQRTSAAISALKDGYTGLQVVPLVPYGDSAPYTITDLTFLTWNSNVKAVYVTGTLPEDDFTLAIACGDGSSIATVDNTTVIFCTCDPSTTLLTLSTSDSATLQAASSIIMCSSSDTNTAETYVTSDEITTTTLTPTKAISTSTTITNSNTETFTATMQQLLYIPKRSTSFTASISGSDLGTYDIISIYDEDSLKSYDDTVITVESIEIAASSFPRYFTVTLEGKSDNANLYPTSGTRTYSANIQITEELMEAITALVEDPPVFITQEFDANVDDYSADITMTIGALPEDDEDPDASGTID